MKKPSSRDVSLVPPNRFPLPDATFDYPAYYFAAPRDEVFKFVPPGSRRVLEVGCGSGAFRAHFASETEYWGIEPRESPANDAAKRLTKVLLGSFHDRLAELPEAYFDLVIINDVIEHMRDYREFLLAVQKVMAPGAVIVGSVPNVRLVSNLARLLIKRDWEYLDAGILDYTHLHFFTQKSLTRELKKAGFNIERLEGINALGSTEHGLPKFLKTVASSAVSLLMGSDTRFVQFAFRAKLPDY